MTESLPDYSRLLDLALRTSAGPSSGPTTNPLPRRKTWISQGPSTYRPPSFGHKGQVCDGWETRRRREPVRDTAIVWLYGDRRPERADLSAEVRRRHVVGHHVPDRAALQHGSRPSCAPGGTPSGSRRLQQSTGTKIFISAGEHDLTREHHPPGAGPHLPNARRALRASACSQCPKFLPKDEGGAAYAWACATAASPAARSSTRWGIKALFTCVMILPIAPLGWLVGEKHRWPAGDVRDDERRPARRRPAGARHRRGRLPERRGLAPGRPCGCQRIAERWFQSEMKCQKSSAGDKRILDIGPHPLASELQSFATRLNGIAILLKCNEFASANGKNGRMTNLFFVTLHSEVDIITEIIAGKNGGKSSWSPPSCWAEAALVTKNRSTKKPILLHFRHSDNPVERVGRLSSS